jgi:hypothetical protein
MSLTTILLAAVLLRSDSPVDEERRVEGILVDQKCAPFYQESGADLPGHGKRCALGCKESGYGVMVGGKYISSNSQGSRLAEEWLEKTTKETDLRVVVILVLDSANQSYTVKSINDLPQ